MPSFSRSSIRHDGKGGLFADVVNLARTGLRMPCEVHPSTKQLEALSGAGLAIPAGVVGEILIDTGASASCIEVEALRSLGIAPLADREVFTPQGRDIQGVYPCSLHFPGTDLAPFPDVLVLGSDLKRQGIIALLGRDLLARGVLVFDGASGHWSLSF